MFGLQAPRILQILSPPLGYACIMTSKQVAASAPGKVLFAGGFLVLDRAHTGLVFGLNARIHVHVQTEEVVVDEQKNELPISVYSPQFKDARWRYLWNQSEGQLQQVKK